MPDTGLSQAGTLQVLRAPTRLQNVLTGLNAVSLLAGIAAITFSDRPDETKEVLAGLVTLYSLFMFIAISRLRTASDWISPVGLILGFGYVSFYVKICIYAQNEAFFFPYWMEEGAPFAEAKGEWLRAFALFLCAQVLFFTGFCFSSGARGARRGVSRRPVSDKAPRRGRYNTCVKLLALGAVAIALRIVVTAVLGLGHSAGEKPHQIGEIPLLAGALQLGSLWGARVVLAAALAFALTSRKRLPVLLAVAETLAFGIASALTTGHRSELLIPVAIMAAIVLLLRKAASPGTVKGFAAVGILAVAAIMVVYPITHEYRYVMSDVNVAEYVAEQDISAEAGFSEGGLQVLRRLHGIEGLVNVLSHENQGGEMPPLSLLFETKTYDWFFTHDLMGVPDHAQIGLGVGLWGGLYLIGGVSCVLASAIALGWFSGMSGMSLGANDDELMAATVAVLMMFGIHVLLFSGNVALYLKQLLVVVVSAALLRYWLGHFGNPNRAVQPTSRRKYGRG